MNLVFRLKLLLTILAALILAGAAQAQTIESVMCALQERHMVVEQRRYVTELLNNYDPDSNQQASQNVALPEPIDWNEIIETDLEIEKYPKGGDLDGLPIGDRLRVMQFLIDEAKAVGSNYVFVDKDMSMVEFAKIGYTGPPINDANFSLALRHVMSSLKQMEYLVWPLKLQYAYSSVAGPNTHAEAPSDALVDIGGDEYDWNWNWFNAEVGNVIQLGNESVNVPRIGAHDLYYLELDYICDYDPYIFSKYSSYEAVEDEGEYSLEAEEREEPFYYTEVDVNRHLGFFTLTGNDGSLEESINGDFYLLGRQHPLSADSKKTVSVRNGNWPSGYEEFRGYKPFAHFRFDQPEIEYGVIKFNNKAAPDSNFATGSIDVKIKGDYLLLERNSSKASYSIFDAGDPEEDGDDRVDHYAFYEFGTSEEWVFVADGHDVESEALEPGYYPDYEDGEGVYYHHGGELASNRNSFTSEGPYFIMDPRAYLRTSGTAIFEPDFKYMLDDLPDYSKFNGAPIGLGEVYADISRQVVYLNIGRGINGVEQGHVGIAISYQKGEWSGFDSLINVTMYENLGAFDVEFNSDISDMPFGFESMMKKTYWAHQDYYIDGNYIWSDWQFYFAQEMSLHVYNPGYDWLIRPTIKRIEGMDLIVDVTSAEEGGLSIILTDHAGLVVNEVLFRDDDEGKLQVESKYKIITADYGLIESDGYGTELDGSGEEYIDYLKDIYSEDVYDYDSSKPDCFTRFEVVHKPLYGEEVVTLNEFEQNDGVFTNHVDGKLVSKFSRPYNFGNGYFLSSIPRPYSSGTMVFHSGEDEWEVHLYRDYILRHTGPGWVWQSGFLNSGNSYRKVTQLEDNPFSDDWPNTADIVTEQTYEDDVAVTTSSRAGIDVAKSWRVWNNAYQVIDYIATDTAASMGSPSNLKTITQYYPGDAAPLPWAVKSITYPDGRTTSFSYSDTSGLLTTTATTGPMETTIIRNGEGHLVSSITTENNVIVGSVEGSSFDDWKRPRTLTFLDGTTIHRTYSPDFRNLVLAETDRNGIQRNYSYDGLGRLIGVDSDVDVDIEYDGFETTSTYSAGGQSYKVGSATNGFGDLLSAYNEFEPATKTTVHDFVYTTKNLATNETTVVSTFPDGGIKSIGGSGVEPVSFEYGVNSGQTYVKRWLEASGGSIYKTTFFDAAGRVAGVETPSASSSGGAAVTGFDYDASTGFLSKITSPDGIETSFKYDPVTSRMNEVIHGGRSVKVDVAYNGGNREVTTKINDQLVRKVVTNPASLVSIIKPFDSSTLATTITPNFTLNNRGVEIDGPYGDYAMNFTNDWALVGASVEDVSGNPIATSSFARDGFSRVTSATSQWGTQISSAVFDELGLITSLDSQGHPANFNYSNGYKDVSVNAPRGMVSATTNGKGELTSYSAPGTPSLSFDTDINPSGISLGLETTSSGAETQWNVNAGGSLEDKDYPNGSGPRLDSSEGGRPESLTSASGKHIGFQYANGTNELTGVSYSGATPDIGLERNGLGLVSKITDGSGTRTLTYHENLLADESWNSGDLGELGRVVIDREYDGRNRPSSLTLYVSGQNVYSVSYGYSGNDPQLRSITSGGNAITYDYTGDRLLDITKFNTNRLVVNRDWDSHHRLDAIDSSADDDFNFDIGYNAQGEIDEVDMGVGDIWAFSYDNAQLDTGTLTQDSLTFCGSTFDYLIDALGRRTGASWGSTTYGFSYGNDLNQATGQTHNGQFDVVAKTVDDPTNVSVNVLVRNQTHPVAHQGLWSSATTASGYYGADYLHDGDAGKGEKWIDYFVTLPPGEYRLDMRWPADAGHATNVPVIVAVGEDRTLEIVDQTTDGGIWNEMRSFELERFTEVSVRIGTVETDGTVVADAIRLVDTGISPAPNVVLDSSASVMYALTTATKQGGYYCTAIMADNDEGPVAADVLIVGERTQTGNPKAVSTQRWQTVVPPASSVIDYDADGNRIGDWRWTYTWNAAGRLQSMEATTEAVAVGLPAYRLEFGYDSHGRRFKKAVYRDSALDYTRYYIYDGWNLIAELDGNHRLVNSYVWGPDVSGGRGAGGIGGLVAVTSHQLGRTGFPVYNHRGDVIALVDSSDGSTLATYQYGPFGEPMRTPEAIHSSLGDANPFRYSTKYTDPETGLAYFGHRYYDPLTGSWLSREPLGEGASPNLYAYCHNDPVNKVDYLGLKDIDWSSIKAAPGNAWDWLVDAWRRPGAFDIFQKDTAQFYIGDPFIGSLKFINDKPIEIADGLNSERQAIGNYESAQMSSLGIFTGVAELGVDIFDYATPDEYFGLFARWHGNVDTFSTSINSAHFSAGKFLGYEAPLMFLGPEMLLDDAFRLGSYSGAVVDWSALRASTMNELRYWREMYEYTSYRSPYLIGPAYAVPPIKPVRYLTAGNPTSRTLSQVRNLRGEARWRAVEEYIQELYGSPGQRHFEVPGTGGRYVDAPVDIPSGVLGLEVKAYQQWRTVLGGAVQQTVPLSAHIRQQILKDVFLRSAEAGFDPRWIFIDAPPSPELARFLADNNIIYIIHH